MLIWKILINIRASITKSNKISELVPQLTGPDSGRRRNALDHMRPSPLRKTLISFSASPLLAHGLGHRHPSTQNPRRRRRRLHRAAQNPSSRRYLSPPLVGEESERKEWPACCSALSAGRSGLSHQPPSLPSPSTAELPPPPSASSPPLPRTPRRRPPPPGPRWTPAGSATWPS